MPTVRIVVKGHVQGVGFRAFVQREASILLITGEVWNRRNGGVEVIASHADTAVLETLAERLQLGPGYVDSLSTEPAPDNNFADFSIVATQ